MPNNNSYSAPSADTNYVGPGAINPPISSLQTTSGSGTTLNNTPLPLLSSNQAPQYFMSSFMEAVDIGENVDGGGSLYIDMLDPRILDFMQNVIAVTSAVYNLDRPITTFAYNAYGNTSIWWLLLMFNGAVHPLEMLAQNLQLLDPASANNVANQSTNQSQRGTTVTL